MNPPCTILVLGAAGQVGAEICDRLTPDIAIIGLPRAEADITNAAMMHQAFTTHAPAVVINAAAYTAVDKAESEPEQAFAINRDGPALLATLCAERDIPLLHISTDYIFAGDAATPYPEDAPPNPLSVYGKSKWEGEEAIRKNCPKHLILRTAWVFGAKGNNFVKTMLRLGAERPELGIVNDQVGGPTPAAAIAETLLTLAKAVVNLPADSPQWGAYHYCGDPAVTWFDFANHIFGRAVDLGLLSQAPTLNPIPTSAYPTPAHRPAYSVLDSGRLDRGFGIPAADWQGGLDDMLKTLATMKEHS